MIFLRQSTASQEIPLGPFVDNIDGYTTEDALSIANTDIKIWKTGATTLANKNSGGATFISGGVYYAVLDATDTDTIGPMRIFCNKSGALPLPPINCCVLDEAVYDVWFGTTAPSTFAGGAVASVTGAVGSVTGSVGSVASGGITAASFAANAITAAKLDPDVTTELQAGLSTLTAAGVRTALGMASADLDVQLAAINGTVGDSNTILDKLDTAMEVDGLVYRFTTNALEQAPAGGGGGATDWTADERTAIRTILGIPASGTTPDAPSAGALKVIDDFLDTEVAAILTAVDTEVAAIKTKTDNLPANTATELATLNTMIGDTDGHVLANTTLLIDNIAPMLGDAVTGIAAVQIVTDKLDTALEADGGVYRYTINALEQAPAGGGGGATDWTADERTAIKTILGIPASGTTPDVPSAGALKVIDDFLDTEIAAILTAVDTEVAAIKAKTDNLPATPAATGDAMTLTGGTITSIQSGLSTLTAAGVRTAVGLASANLDTQLAAIPTTAAPTAAAIVSQWANEDLSGGITRQKLLEGYILPFTMNSLGTSITTKRPDGTNLQTRSLTRFSDALNPVKDAP